MSVNETDDHSPGLDCPDPCGQCAGPSPEGLAKACGISEQEWGLQGENILA